MIKQKLLSIKPVGGGTSFTVIFQYIAELDEEELPSSIVILTDGYAFIPEEKDALGIPVLWVLNNDKVDISWGGRLLELLSNCR